MKKLTTKAKIVGTIAALATATAAYALPEYWDEYDYYSDASYSEHVGTGGRLCSGRTYLEGVKTNYKIQTLHVKC